MASQDTIVEEDVKNAAHVDDDVVVSSGSRDSSVTTCQPDESNLSCHHDVEKSVSLSEKEDRTNDEEEVDDGAGPVEKTITSVSADRPYSAFTQRQKMLIVFTATMGTLFSPFTANIYLPALSSIAVDLDKSISQINLTITTYMIFQGIAPSFISSITDAQGRRPTYVIGFIVYIAANLGLTFNDSYAGLLVLRCVQSCGSSGLVTLAQATIADIVTSAERGKYIGITSLSSIVAPSVAPIIGGVLAQHLGWHSIFWFLLILSGVFLVPLLLWFPETSRKVVGDGSIPPPPLNKSILRIIKDHRHSSNKDRTKERSAFEIERDELTKQRGFQWPNPVATLAVFADKEMAILLFYASISYAAFFAVSASLTVQFHDIYHLDETKQGLLFLPQALGSILSAVTNSIWLDKNYRRHATRNNLDPCKKKQIDLRQFPIERARLELVLPLMVINALAMIVYGWMLQFQIHIAGPLVMLVVIGYTTLAAFNALSVLNLDLNRHRAASASAAANLSRCLCGAGMTAVVNPMIEAMGRGWCFTLTGLLELVLLPSLWLCMRYGVKWRSNRSVAK